MQNLTTLVPEKEGDANKIELTLGLLELWGKGRFLLQR